MVCRGLHLSLVIFILILEISEDEDLLIFSESEEDGNEIVNERFVNKDMGKDIAILIDSDDEPTITSSLLNETKPEDTNDSEFEKAEVMFNILLKIQKILKIILSRL